MLVGGANSTVAESSNGGEIDRITLADDVEEEP